MKRIVALLLSFILFLASYAVCEETIKMATTTSTYETGILDYILKPFEEKYNVKVHIISVGTGKAIKLGENGDVDVILVHSPDAEEKFVRDGSGVNRRDIMYNDFIIAGPENDPAGIGSLQSAKEALKKIRDEGYVFVSRGDDSGTHKKEKDLWRQAGIEPDEQWYLETGQGMSDTLRIADEKNAYVMADRATYLFNKDKIRLRKLVDGDKDLFNHYGVITVNPHKHPHVNYRLSKALIEWLIFPECQSMINKYTVRGSQLFHGVGNYKALSQSHRDGPSYTY